MEKSCPNQPLIEPVAMIVGFGVMSQDESALVSVAALRAKAYSPDGTSVVISLRTRYSNAERKYSVPLECFQDLIVDLRRLNASTERKPAEPSRGIPITAE